MRLRIIVSLPLVLLFVTIATSAQSAQTGNPQGTPQPSVNPATTAGPQRARRCSDISRKRATRLRVSAHPKSSSRSCVPENG